MQLTKFSKLKIIHTPGKNFSVADMLSRSFTKAELQLNQLKHKQLPPQISHHKTPTNMTLTQLLLIMVQINFPFVLMIKEMTLLSNLYNPSRLNL